MKSPLFYAKIILFGEYGIIQNSKGLIIPFNDYKGVLHFDSTDKSEESNQHLKRFAKFLDEKFPKEFNTKEFIKDTDNGMHFDSDIPQGYGVGSSGALVAAIYDRYAIEKIDIEKNISKENIAHLKLLFGKMESFFHGTSSGIDPLICYMGIPLLIQSKDDISTVGMPAVKEGKGAIFLINSGAPGETAPMIQIFFDKLKNDGFRKTLKEEFINYNNACIEDFVKGDFKPLFSNLKKLSSWAFEHFQPMIPLKLMDAWKTGIETNSYYLKLCGSGGGGYVLGFTEDYEQAKLHLANYNTEIVYRF